MTLNPFILKTQATMKLILIIIALLIAFLSYLAITRQENEDFEAKIYNSSAGNSIPYRIHMPENMDTNKKYPLVIFFHGSGERGMDNANQLIHGVRDILTYSIESDDPAIIIVPQSPQNKQWVNVPWDTDSHLMSEEPSQSMKLTIALMQDIISNQPVDMKRIYVTGLSMGGFGAWDILQRLPHLFAAAIPVCGGGDATQAEKIKDIPIWAFHGDKDAVVKTKRSRDMIAAIKKSGGKPQYTEYKGVAHDSWTQTYSDKNVLRWLFTQQKI
jgi:predicted peptidase